MTAGTTPGQISVWGAPPLSAVRQELEMLTWTRLLHPLTGSDAERYATLCELERELLQLAKTERTKKKRTSSARKTAAPMNRQPTRSADANPVERRTQAL